MEARVEVRLTSSLSEPELEAIAQQRAGIDYGLPAWGYQWALKTWRVLVWASPELVSHAGLLQRTVEVEGQRLEVGGISGVWTVAKHRGQGYGSAALKAAAAFMRDELGVDYGLLLCREPVQPFYQRLGWHPVPGPMVFDQPFGKVTWPLSLMVLPCQSQEWPEGRIDLCGWPW